MGSDDMSPAAATVAWLLVDNVLEHTLGDPILIVEEIGGVITIAVEDASSSPTVRREHRRWHGRGGRARHRQLTVADVGSAPTSTGKTVWAILGPENRL